MPAIMIMNKEKLIPFLAMIVLLIGITSTLYVHATQSNQVPSELLVNGNSYNSDSLFEEITSKSIETDEGVKTGIALDNLIYYTGLTNPEEFQYTFKATDGYQKTVPWENLDKGVFTKENRIFFSDLAHAFWVRDIIEIEVGKI